MAFTPLAPLHHRSRQRQCQLMRKQLIIGQPQPRRRSRRKIGLTFRRMGGVSRCSEIRPVLARLQRSVDPFGKIRQACQCAPRRLSHLLLRDPGRQRVDRFVLRNLGLFSDRQDMVGVNHLCHAVENLDLAGHQTALAGRQLLFQPILAGMKEDELKGRGLVLHVDPVGPALLAGRKMQADLDLNGHRRGGLNVADTIARGGDRLPRMAR